MTVIKKTDNNNREDMERLKPSYAAGGNGKWFSHCGGYSGSSFKA